MYRIEKATLGDIDTLVQIQMAAFANDQQICGSGPPGFDSVQHQSEALGLYAYYVVKSHEDVVGGFYFDIQGTTLHLMRLFIHPSCQSQGVGSLVFPFLSQEVAFIKTIELETPTFSLSAQRFYERNGFQQITRVEYEEGCSYLYRKAL